MKNTQVSFILRIRFSNLFFRSTTPEEVVKVTCSVNIKKSCQTTDIPTKVIKLNSDILAKFKYKHFKQFDTGEFPNELTHSELVAVHKKTVNVKKKTLDL